MDKKRKKELLNEWKNRHRFQLSATLFPNKKLQKLWNKYGEQAFEYSVVEVLEYENPQDDQTDSLLELLECCMIEMPSAGRI